MMDKNTKAKWGNSFAYVLLPFTIGLRDDPLDYVREAKSTIDRKKHSFEALFTFSIIGLVFQFFGIKVYVKCYYYYYYYYYFIIEKKKTLFQL